MGVTLVQIYIKNFNRIRWLDNVIINMVLNIYLLKACAIQIKAVQKLQLFWLSYFNGFKIMEIAVSY